MFNSSSRHHPRLARFASALAVVAVGALALTACGTASTPPEDDQADSAWPERRIEYIIPYDPGGATDAAGRAFAERLGEELGTTVVPVNQPGGSGLVGVTAAVTAEPDGYTLGFGSPGGILIQPLIDPTIATATTDDYTPVALMGTGPFSLMVRGDAPWETLEDFVDYAKEHPGELQIATTGGAAINTFVIHAFADAADIEVTPIPFDGSAEGQRALLGGQVPAFVASASGVIGLVDSGDLRALAVSGSEPFAQLPDVPTFDSEGYAVPFEGAYLTIAPKGLPDDVREKLFAATEKILASDDWKQWCAENGTTPKELVGADLTAWIADQQTALKPYLELVQAAG
ncbi:Bug family tripartite tricarboxylate transporter substrate binding protein [Microbacterium ulmi]|uniref:Tripartite tricarboxylate transporter substrate binding protein n=1 Tax=Microbacterium ulmi TaxID=179095 RepID=A0A7Y2LYH6_9MICO|nr:tripartite tricarboxylate transporter substrate binding protein [Microbacterium ulmi]NII69853.1 putative tricarboxylic transport membrane protein [Microbacterium ulmi]NNH03180.1 tripartite tricarboxylate transporter substrate binding protein [Microbacterium ulmi]